MYRIYLDYTGHYASMRTETGAIVNEFTLDDAKAFVQTLRKHFFGSRLIRIVNVDSGEDVVVIDPPKEG